MDKLKNFFNKYLKHYMVGLFAGAILLNLFIETMARHNPLQALGFMIQSPLVFLCNVLIIFALLTVSLLFKRRAFAACVLSIVWIALGLANGMILINRLTPFTIYDLSSLKDAASIATNYFSLKTIIIALVAIALAVVLFIVLFRKLPKLKEKVNYKRAVAAIVVVFVGTFGIVQIGMKAGVLETFFGNLPYGYRDNGVPYSFIVTWMSTGISKPAEYSEEMIQGIFDGGELGEDGIYSIDKDNDTNVKKTPNILFLQLESFMDPLLLTGVEFDKDPIPNYRKLMDQYSSGTLTVPAVGAGTANIEFEVMTGISVKFFGPGEYPYKSILRDVTCESAPYNLKTLGYSAHAIHNHRGAFYYRNKVFANMGFDTFTCLEYMNNVMKTPKNWAKDAILTEEIINAMDSTEKQDYIYTISVQGHGKYPAEQVIEEPTITVTEAPTEEQKWAYEYYANQIYEMDLFIKELTDALANYDEDVILVMYGDHLPALDGIEQNVEDGELYHTQFVIWDNFGMKEKDMNLATYELNAEVLDRLGISVGMMTKYHQNYKDEKDFKENLKALAYDMLYGKSYIYGGTTPFEPTDLQMGVRKIKINEIVQIGENYYIKGENFTEYSKISLDGEVLKTVYLGPSILALKEEVDPEEVSNMKVSQVEKNKEVLSTTE